MPREKNRGTQKYCPDCKKVTVCTAFNPSILAGRGGQRLYKSDHYYKRLGGQRFYRLDHFDIQWFRRALYCQECEYEWLTAEVEEKYLNELFELRDALYEIEDNTEQYIKESGKESKSLKKLSDSLSIIKALKIFPEQD